MRFLFCTLEYRNGRPFGLPKARPLVGPFALRLAGFRDTWLFLQQEGVSESHGNAPPEGATTVLPKDDDGFGPARVGDLVEVEIAGTLLTADPVRVRAMSADREWVFVEGSETGIAMENVTVVERPAAGDAPKTPPVLPLEAPNPDTPQTPAGYRSETFNADEGDIRITWPSNLSAQSVEDMRDWLELLKRRIARRAGASEASDGE